jgi:hypothetical protein
VTLMDLVICPNGHPNRPGRAQCVVCKAPLPLPPDAAKPAAPPPAPRAAAAPPTAKPAPPAATDTAAPPSGASQGSRWPVWLLLGLTVAAIALAWALWPRLRDGRSATQLVPPAATAPALPAVVAPTETLPVAMVTEVVVAGPTDLPPTEPPPTAAPPTPPPATDDPTSPPPATATIDPSGSELLTHGNLIANGDFAEGWVQTWLRQVSDNNGVQAAETVPFDDAPSPAGLRLTKTGSGTTRLQQIIDVPRRATELRFTGDLRLSGSVAADGVSEGRVALMLSYLDENDAALGHTVWIDGSQPASTLWGRAPLPAFGPQLSPRYALDEGWQTIDIRLQEELVNRLPGLDAGRIRRVAINLLALASDTCGPTDCPVTLEVANLQFLPTDMR